MTSVSPNGSSDKTPRAAIYLRVSSSKQETDGTSLETQEEAARAYCAEHGYTVVKVFREVESGAVLHERACLSELRAMVRNRVVDRVVCHSVDRLSRNQAHLYILAEEFENHIVRLEFVTEAFEDTAVGKFLRSAKAFAAEVEREKFKERSFRGRRARVAAGKLIHGKAPMYGYAWHPEEGNARYVIDPATAPIVRRIFEEALNGGTFRSIAARLTADGIPSPRGARVWDFTTVGHILREERYAGIAYAFRIRQWKEGGRVHHAHRPRTEWVELPEGTIPPLIDRATFDAVQRRIAQNKKEAARRLANPEQFLLRGGYVQCGHCGDAMSARNALSRGKRRPQYFCPRGNRGPVSCTHHAISAHVLDAAVWSKVEALLTRPDIVAAQLDETRRNDPTERDLAAIDAALVDIERRKQNLSRSLSLFTDMEAAAPVIQHLEALHRQHASLLSEQEAIVRRRNAWEAAQYRIQDIQAWCRGVSERLHELSYDEKRLALVALNVQVRVWRADHDPRYVITAEVPLDDNPVSQTDHMTRLYDASQNHHSYRLLIT